VKAGLGVLGRTPEWKAEVPTLDLLKRMVTDPLPLGLSAGLVEPFFQRTYTSTPPTGRCVGAA